MELAGIKNIVFDLGGVLINLNRQRCIDAYKALGYADAENLLGNYRQEGLFLLLEEGRISPEEFRNAIRKEIKQEVTDKQLDDALMQFLLDLPAYKLELLRRLKKDYKVYMLSNTNKIMFDHIVPHYFGQNGTTIDDYFDGLFLSFEMGVAKPDKKIFEMMIEQGQLVPEETLFIDDSSLNTDAASDLGFYVYTAEPEEDFTFLFEE
ncbi:MAG: HAD family hydrolase [Bacteroidales bacterium]